MADLIMPIAMAIAFVALVVLAIVDIVENIKEWLDERRKK